MDGKVIPRTWVIEEVDGRSKSAAIRHILDNGIQYMAIYGDGVEKDQ